MVRSKYRYISVKIVCDDKQAKFKENIIAKTIWKHVEKYYGDLGVAAIETGFTVKYNNPQTRLAMIRCRHKPHRFVTSILPLITVIGDYRAKFSILYIGATMVQSYKFMVKYQEQCIGEQIGKIELEKFKAALSYLND